MAYTCVALIVLGLWMVIVLVLAFWFLGQNLSFLYKHLYLSNKQSFFFFFCSNHPRTLET